MTVRRALVDSVSLLGHPSDHCIVGRVNAERGDVPPTQQEVSVPCNVCRPRKSVTCRAFAASMESEGSDKSTDRSLFQMSSVK
jgi:hypothetical protein